MPAPPTPGPNNRVEELPVDEEEEEEDKSPTPDVTLTTNKVATSFLRKYFNSAEYYNMIDLIFNDMDNIYKSFIRENYINTTNTAVKEDTKHISKAAYKETVDGLSVKSNPGAGDCFFIAVADAINYHNHYNPNDKITYGNIGKGFNIFTKAVIRKMVTKYILGNPNKDTYLQSAIVDAENLNEIFKNTMNTMYSTEADKKQHYMSIIDDVYTSHPNFFILKPNSIPVSTNPFSNGIVLDPFRAITESEIANYIESKDYWANEVAISAVGSEIGLNVIPIERSQTTDTLRIPFADFSATINGKEWTKYLFLYYYNAHYEIMSFKYSEKGSGVKQNKIDKTYTIFDKRSTVIPPYYILFLIYAAYYFETPIPKTPQTFSLQPGIFDVMNASLNKLCSRPNNEEAKYFVDKFSKNFPYNKTKIEAKLAPGHIGGNPYNNNPYNTPANTMFMEKDRSNICYNITIDMELVKGTTITDEQMSQLSCRNRWNAVRRSYANFTGRKYVIPPVYEVTPPTNNTTKKQDVYRGGGRRHKTRKRNRK